MAEYINREKILEDIGTDIAAFTLSMVFRHIRNAPPADVAEVKHGKCEDYGSGVCCSECGISLFHQDTNNNGGIEPSGFIYCPHCGAKMDLED